MTILTINVNHSFKSLNIYKHQQLAISYDPVSHFQPLKSRPVPERRELNLTNGAVSLIAYYS